MRVLSLTLSPETVGRIHDALVCLGKFSDAVTIESDRSHFWKLLLSAFNSTKSAYASFKFVAEKCFLKYKYHLQGTTAQSKDRFTCSIYNKALISIFKGRLVDPSRERDTDIERCELIIEDGFHSGKNRFIVTMICRHGVLKTYQLNFESVPSVRVMFDESQAHNRWSIHSRVLRDFVEHFGPKTENLDIYSAAGKATFTSYTERIMSGNEVLKQPLHTSITIDTLDFDEFSVEDDMHIVLSVKDFKAIVSHAATMPTMVTATYSQPTRPMSLSYIDADVICNFILMTTGESRGISANTSAPQMISSRAGARQTLGAAQVVTNPSLSTAIPQQPSRADATWAARNNTKAQESRRPSPPPPQPTLDSNALFFPDDDDRRWDPADSADEEEGRLGWDASADNAASASSARILQDKSRREINSRGDAAIEDQRLPPTQRMSQIRGLFDD